MGVEDRYKKKQEEEKSTSLYNGVENRYIIKNVETIGQEINDRVNTWFTNYNNYISNAQYRFSGNNTSYRTDASDWLTTVTAQRESFQKEAEGIKSMLTQYKDFFDKDYVNSVFDALDNGLKSQDSVIDASTKDLEYWSQWESEDDFNEYVASIEEYNAKLNFDLEAGKAEIDKLEAELESIGDLTLGDRITDWVTSLGISIGGQASVGVPSKKELIERYQNELAEKRQYYGEAERLQTSVAMSSVANPNSENYDADFEKYAQIGYDMGNETTSGGYKNKIVGYRTHEAAQLETNRYANGTNTDLLLDIKLAQKMTDDEVKIYSYYLAKYGENKAQEYLDSIEESLNLRVATGMYENVKDNTFAEYVVGVAAGLDQFGSGIENLFSNEDYYIPSATQIASGMIREDLADTGATLPDWLGGGSIGQAGYDMVTTTSNMMPSILISFVPYVGTALGAVSMGASAAGNAKAEMINLGYSKEQANAYGMMVGASEAGLQYLLGGISKLGGKASGKLISKAVSKVDNAFARVAIQLGGNMLSEGVEEGLQEILDPWFKSIATGVDFEAANAGDVLYASLLGALSAGLLEGGSTIASNISSSVQAKKTYGDNVQDLVTEALEINPNNVHAQRMQTKLDSGKKISGYQINRLVEANETAMHNQDVSAIQSSIETRLTQLGETGNVNAIAAALTKQASGENLTLSEKNLIKNSKYGQRVANELNTENIKSGEYSSSWAERIGTNRINAEEYGRLIAELEAQDNELGSNMEQVADDSRQVTGKLPASETEIATDANVGDKKVQTAQFAEPTAASEGLTDEVKTESTSDNTTAKENATESEISAPDEVADTEGATITLETASKAYGAQAGAMIATYTEGQDVAQYDVAYRAAYNMGKSGVNLSYAMNSPTTAYLTEKQRELAHAAGVDASNAKAKVQDAENKSKINGKTGRRKGVVKGEGVSIDYLKKTFNDKQGTAYRLLSTYAEATGIDIVLYNSTVNADGEFEGAQGRFKWSEDTIYIDINAGLTNIKDVNDLAKYTMMRTFSHEFVHFIEKWNPIWYNEFRKVVFDTLTERGENVNDLIETKMSQDSSGKMTYDKASREVVAEAMTDILPDTDFIEELATKHKTIFDKLLEKFKEFVAKLKAYFNSLHPNSSREANALKEQVGEGVKYVENIVKLFDKIAVEAVENYQATVATEEADRNGLTGDEIDAIYAYKSGGSYTLNAKLRYGLELDVYDQEIVNHLDKALEKMPTYKGTVYRVIEFDGFGDKAARDAYVADHIIGEIISYDAYTSSSTVTDGYVLTGDFVVRHVIQSENGRNLEGYGSDAESEVLFARTTDFITDRIEYDSIGTPTIYLTEVAYGQQAAETQTADRQGTEGNVSRNNSGESGSWSQTAEENKVQRLHSQNTGNSEVQSAVSKRNTVNSNSQQGNLQGIQAEVSDNAIVDQSSKEGKKKHNKNPVRTRKSDWTSHDVEWYIPGKKTPIAYSTVAASDLIEELSKQYPSATISQLLPAVNYDVETKKVLQQYVDAGYGNQIANEWFNHSKKEAKTNVENVDNRGTVQQPDTDRQGNPRVLDEVQTEDVPRDAPRGDSVGDSVERGQQAVRDDVRSDIGAGTRGRSSERDSQSRDIRRDDELTSETEKLHEEVTEQVAQQSTEQPKGRNFVIGDSLDLPNGEKSRYKANVEAIRLVKQLEAEGRYATEAEQVILSKYVGWGGLANAFDQRKAEWAKEYAELKELLSDEEYASARGSTLNAHFTDISVIKAMYDGLASLGFNGGRMLEPSSGVGNFVGAMPTAMASKVKSWTMVELDSITGMIAKYLYPNADVRIQGFEKANIPDNYMDVAISNVPFGNYAITDKAYPKKVTSAIHNYFFAKSLDKVRPGGIVMFITSSYTMNAKENTVRRYIMQRADLLGAIRLPDSAFKGNAGTEVVTDILILKKRAANTTYAGEDFLEAPWTRLTNENYNGAYINSYFNAHPEMVLGTPSMDGGMYRGGSLTYKALEGRGSLADQIREAFSHIEGKMEYPTTLSREKTNFAVERANKKTKENGLIVRDGKVYQNKGGELIEVNKAKGAAERISSMLEIRDAARDLMNYQQQGLNDAEIKKARTQLNNVYDAFVKKYGFINASANKNAIKEDPDCFSLFALENWNPEIKKATKADIFSKNTIAPNRTVTSAKDVSEGLIVSVNQTGGVDTGLIARLTGKTEADVTRELIDSRKAFKNRNGELEAAEVYLSGNVRAKLRDAEALVPIDSDYKNNVEALKSVMPEDVGYEDIFVNPGTPWIPNSVYSDFAAHMLGTRNTDWRQAVDVTRNAETGNFTVELKERYLKTNSSNTQKWGTSRRTFLELFDAMLNSKSVVIKDKLDDGSFVVNKDATAAANEKIENIQKEFQEWLWKDEARRTELTTLYNETFNSVVTPKYNGDNLTVNGANALKPLRPHQRNAVQRVISSGGNTLLAHKVGAGKTYEMAAAAMKLKELGLVKKPMFAVPKSLVAQWGNEFIDFFPTAKLLVAEASDFTAANRKIFMNRIANGEYDAVIVSYEQFEKLPMSDDFTRQLYQEQIDSVIAAIEEAKADKGDKALSVKDLEKKRKSLQAKIDKLTDKAKDEDNIDFEQLGVDSLFIDEAHNFKNLFYTTSMTNVSGLGNKDGSKRAFDLYTKVRYLQQLNGGRGIVFATATPVMNSMSEMYIMQKYLQPDLLDQLGLSTFDAWAKQFGEVVNGVEIKPSGQGYRVKQSFSRFKNMSELQLLFRNFADVLTDIPGLKIPKMKGGKVNVVVCDPGQFQQDFMKELEQRADNIKNVDPSEDNMLKITSDGRKISYTQRMIDPSLPYEEGCKIFRCAENVIKEYNDSKAIKGTQIIFLDMATPKGKSDNTTETDDLEMDIESAQLYDDLKARLRQGGIPAQEIAFIHDADTDQKKKKLFADVNDGKVRVLIGSTGKMGVGMNAQKRIVAIHHLDAPWRPGDVEQRDGRAFRQGNINDEVSKYTYVTEGSFDARLWDILERKQNFINQVMNGESVGRETEDTGEVTLSAAEVKALASGSPLIMEQVQLDTDIKKLESLYRAHISAVRSAKERLSRDNGEIARLEKQIANGKADAAARVDTYSEGKFSITIGKQTFTDVKEAGVALMAEATAKATFDGYTTIGSFAGFNVRVVKTSEGIKGLLSGKQGYPFNVYPTNTTRMVNNLASVAESIDEKVKLLEHNLKEIQKDIAEQEKLIAEPFAKQTELDSKRARYNEVMAILNPKEEQSLDSVAEDTVQEQSRAYLNNADSEYMEAVNTGDMATAQRMVDEVAEEAGYTIEAYHGSHTRFTVFSHAKAGGLFNFTENEQAAQAYAFGGGGGRGGNVVAVDSNGIAWEYDKDAGGYVAVGVTNDYAESGRLELSPVPEKYKGRVLEEKFVNDNLTDYASDGEFTFVPKDATTGNYFIKAERSLDLVNDKETAKRVFREIAQRFEQNKQNYSDLRQGEISKVINRILWDYKNDYLGFWGITKDEYSTRVFQDFIVPELKRMGYDSIYYSDDSHKTYAVFDPNQIKSADAVTYGEGGNVIPLSERFNTDADDIRYQQRTTTLSDREVLAMAASELMATNLTDAERDALQIFQSRLSRLEGLQEDRTEQGRLYKEQQFGTKVDREAAAQTLNRMHVLDDQIKKAKADVLSLEDKEVLGSLMKKARKVVESEQRSHDAEILKRYRDRTRNAAAIKKYRERIQKDVKELSSWVEKPNNKDIVKHIPDALKNSVIPFLTSIDFTSKQQLRGGEATKADAEFMKRLRGLDAALKRNIDVDGMYSGYNDLPPNFMEKLRSFIDTVQGIINKHSGGFVINEMTSEELKELSDVVRVIKSYITQFNKFHANAMYSHVWEAGDNTISVLSGMASDNGKAGKGSNFVFWQQMRPAYAFERFGEGGLAIYDGLRRGQAQLAFNTQKIVKFTEKTYTDKEVNAWEKEIKTIKLGKDTVKMKVSHIMSFYELSKQPDSLRHMLGEGMRVATYTQNGKKISDNGHMLTETDIAEIVGKLTDRQKEVADALQKFMQEQGGAWGNYVSVARFGEELFTNEQYFPINSDGRHLQSTADENPSAASLYALLNMSFTKSRNEHANNRIIVYSIFDVFANHMASMAQYNAMALPVLDAIKWFNYQQKTEDANGKRYVKASVREQMDRVYGVPEETRPGSGKQGYAQSFVLNILKAFNGTEAQGVPADTMGMNALRQYNMAQIAYNFRVVIQQPLAITRAALLIDYTSIMKGMKLKPSAIKQNIEEMRKYSGIAAWKSLGFYDVNISRGLTDTIKHSTTAMQKIGDIGMWGAERADTLAWSAIWSACKEEVIKKQRLRPSDVGFYEAVTKLFEDVIYKTQVVDSILTKNEYMRSKGFFARAMSSFMSEPTTTASMLIDSVDKFNADMKRGMTRQQAWEKNKRMVGRTMYVYAVSAVMLAAVQAVADAFRDDDDYETFIEKWLEAFGGNLVDELMPINKLPILSDFYDLGKEVLSVFGVDTYGNPPQSVFMQWYDSLVKGTQIIYDKIAGEDTNYTWYGGIYKLLQAASGMSGLPLGTATREIVTAWNNIIGYMAPSLKVKTYDSGDMNNIKYAYQDGYLTFDEAVAALLEQGLVDNADEAYFTVSGWEAGEGYSRYDAIYEAVRTGGDIDAAMQDLISHGYTEKEVLSQVTAQIGKWYYDENSDYRISKQQAIDMLTKYTNMTEEEITKKVNEWSAVVVTGIKYSEIDDEYLAGNITADRAKEMYMRYGGMTKEEAENKITVIDFVKEHPECEGISSSAVLSYKEYCEPQGIDAEIFYDVWQFYSNATSDVDRKGNIISGSKKEKVLDYIDSLNLSNKQKDSLYYAFGWAESTIRDAPWR